MPAGVATPETKAHKGKKVTQESSQSKKLSPAAKTKLLQLIRYYRECIQTENLSDIELYADKQGAHFLQCPAEKEWLSSEKENIELSLSAQDAQNFAKPTRYRKRTASFYYGYPLYIHRFKRRDSGQENVVIRPFLIVPVEYEKNGERVQMTRTETYRPQVNTGVLRARSVAPRPEQQRAFMEQIYEKWNEKEGFEANFTAIANLIKDEFGTDNYIDPNLEKLNSTPVDFGTAESGFYSSGILFYSQGSQYTFGLEEELEEIEKKIDTDELKSLPVLDALIMREITGGLKESTGESLLAEITMLNDEQRAAIRSAFENTMTVVTGPPGTGKSQVVLNIIANAIANGQTVLFGSKNHKAVDVVLERIDAIQSQPVTLKFGQNARESLFAERLLAAVDKAQGYDQEALEIEKKEAFDEMQNIATREDRIWDEIKSTYNFRNKVVELEARADHFEEKLSEELKAVLASADAKLLSQASSKKIEGYLKEIRSGQTSIVSNVLGFFGRSMEKRGSEEIKKQLLVVAKADALARHFDSALKGNAGIEDVFAEYVALIERSKAFQKSEQERLSKSTSASKIAVLENEFETVHKKRIELSPRYLDAYAIERLKNLPSDKRREIADYKAMVQRIETDRVGGDIVKDLRKQKKDLFESVVKVFPSIAVTNLSVRHAVPLKEEVVDLVVLDEASQCDIASAIPMLVRAKRAVIIGDRMQLAHVSTIALSDDQQIQSKYQLSDAADQRFLYSTQSIFDLAKSTIGTSSAYVALKDHFRSRAEIIAYSNDAFYGGELRVWTDYRQLKGTGLVNGIHWHDVQGKVVRPSGGSAYNLEEANKVIEVLKEILPKAASTGASVGVVTPFREQENKIKDMAFKHFDLHLLDAVNFWVDTAHGYQGDERDIIVFSPVISAGTPDRTLGFLANTQNLFNVAVTRPRAELHVVGDRQACAKCKVQHLSKFAEYMTRAQSINIYHQETASKLFDSPWEEIFYKKLKEKGVQTTPQLAIHQYRLDLAIEGNNSPIDIEIDGEAYHREISGRRCIEDVKRDIRLNLMGWVVKRFWVYELKYEMDRCVNEVLALLNGKKAN
jgi:very-short-patch-repair endonuclease/RecA/RadA recombinase